SRFTFAPGFQVEIAGPADKTFTEICTNRGTVRWTGNARLLSQGYSSLVNEGQWIFETNGVFDSLGYPSGTFTNTGTILRSGAGTAQWQILNTPVVNVGTIAVATNSVLEIVSSSYGLMEFETGTVFNGDGLLRFPAN